LLFILTGISFGIAMVVPETWRPVLLSRTLKELDGADNQQKPDLAPILKTALIRPFQMMCTEPLLIAMSIYLCFIYMLLYLLFFAFPIAFVEVRGFSVGMVGTTFVSIIVSRGAGSWDLCLTSPSTDRSICPYNKIGILIAGCLLRYQEILYAREMAKRARPEARLFPMMLGCMQVLPAIQNPSNRRWPLTFRFASPWAQSTTRGPLHIRLYGRRRRHPLDRTMRIGGSLWRGPVVDLRWGEQCKSSTSFLFHS